MTEVAAAVAVASVALAAIFFSFFRDSSRGMVVLVAVMATPLFLKVSGSGIELGDAVVASGIGQTFPISLPAVALVCGLVVLKSLKEEVGVARSPLNVLVALLVFWNALAFLAGLLMDFRLENGLFLVQTLTPMFAFFVPMFLLRRAVDAVRALTACVFVIGTWVIALLAFTVATRGSILDAAVYGFPQHLFIFPLYTLHDYVPLVVTVGYGVGRSHALPEQVLVRRTSSHAKPLAEKTPPTKMNGLAAMSWPMSFAAGRTPRMSSQRPRTKSMSDPSKSHANGAALRAGELHPSRPGRASPPAARNGARPMRILSVVGARPKIR